MTRDKDYNVRNLIKGIPTMKNFSINTIEKLIKKNKLFEEYKLVSIKLNENYEPYDIKVKVNLTSEDNFDNITLSVEDICYLDNLLQDINLWKNFINNYTFSENDSKKRIQDCFNEYKSNLLQSVVNTIKEKIRTKQANLTYLFDPKEVVAIQNYKEDFSKTRSAVLSFDELGERFHIYDNCDFYYEYSKVFYKQDLEQSGRFLNITKHKKVSKIFLRVFYHEDFSEYVVFDPDTKTFYSSESLDNYSELEHLLDNRNICFFETSEQFERFLVNFLEEGSKEFVENVMTKYFK